MKIFAITTHGSRPGRAIKGIVQRVHGGRQAQSVLDYDDILLHRAEMTRVQARYGRLCRA